MMIREQSRGYGVADDISTVIGDVRYAQNWYPPGLKALTVGTHSLDLVSVSRYYFLIKPRVVVDFEPSPLDGKMWAEEKRQWCFDQGIVYIPIMLRERLTPEQFKARYDQERHALLTGSRVITENKGLAMVTVEDVIKHLPPDRTVTDVLTHPTTEKWIDAETLRRFEAKFSTAVKGATRMAALGKLKREVIAELREKVKHGRLGSFVSDQQPAVAAGG